MKSSYGDKDGKKHNKFHKNVHTLFCKATTNTGKNFDNVISECLDKNKNPKKIDENQMIKTVVQKNQVIRF